jgi:hypothetical protein
VQAPEQKYRNIEHSSAAPAIVEWEITFKPELLG